MSTKPTRISGTAVRRSWRTLGAASALLILLALALTPGQAAGSVVCTWGNDSECQLGNGTYDYTTNRTSPVLVLDAGTASDDYLEDVAAIAGGFFHTRAVKSDGTVWSWGWNNWGQLGLGYATSPITRADLSRF